MPYHRQTARDDIEFRAGDALQHPTKPWRAATVFGPADTVIDVLRGNARTVRCRGRLDLETLIVDCLPVGECASPIGYMCDNVLYQCYPAGVPPISSHLFRR
jgi:hypothetical protein